MVLPLQEVSPIVHKARRLDLADAMRLALAELAGIAEPVAVDDRDALSLGVPQLFGLVNDALPFLLEN